MNRFVIAEPSKCIGCRTCEVACALAHADGERVAALSRDNFSPRLKVIIGQKVTAPVQCRHCEDAPCVNVCPTGAVVYHQNSVQVIEERCVGCKTCVIACPFGAMEVVSKPVRQADLGVAGNCANKVYASKCDLCIDRSDGPACIAVCPTKALHLVDHGSIDAMARKKQARALVESGTAGLR